MILTVLACVVGYLAVGVLVAIVGGVIEICEARQEYTFAVFLWPIMVAFGLAGMAKGAADGVRYALAARKPPTEDEL
jgi:ABC-type xylose transport system permease subunit